jgi:hypothetical protein
MLTRILDTAQSVDSKLAAPCLDTVEGLDVKQSVDVVETTNEGLLNLDVELSEVT